MKKIGVLLSGCGVYDGVEIHESVFTMLAIQEAGAEYICISVNKPQHHVVNHLTGEEMKESRNMMIEAARIARGNVKDITEVDPADIDALVIPGGFGSAKNFTSWAFEGPEGMVLPEVKLLIVNMINIGKPVCALCVSPVVVSKALEDSDIHATMTLGTTEESSPYDIQGFSDGIKQTGVEPVFKTVKEVQVDTVNRIVSAPCYMMDANMIEVRNNIKSAIEETINLIEA
ncbi:isoprenoid biosynthesis glyoxalase ElbB [Wandonia haliotis]|uniref:Isoprenoid biosynthesis glyoxalase ElbB n=1 Tax=Wandonia haliotis TaxID=574963 RepID=A0ABN1MSP4_9FLAO